MVYSDTVKIQTNWDTENIVVIILKFEQFFPPNSNVSKQKG